MNKTIQAYEDKAQVYHDETEEFWNNFPQTTVKAFVERLKGRKVLNVGSGSGRDTLILRSKKLEVVCVDGAKEMVRRTQEMGFESILCDFMKMKFGDESFDGVWAYTSLLHISRRDMELVIEKIYNFLKPNGIFLIGMIEGEYDGDVSREGWEGSDRYFRFYTEEDLTKIVSNIGFKLENQERYQPHSKVYLSQIYSKI